MYVNTKIWRFLIRVTSWWSELNADLCCKMMNYGPKHFSKSLWVTLQSHSKTAKIEADALFITKSNTDDKNNPEIGKYNSSNGEKLQMLHSEIYFSSDQLIPDVINDHYINCRVTSSNYGLAKSRGHTWVVTVVVGWTCSIRILSGRKVTVSTKKHTTR